MLSHSLIHSILTNKVWEKGDMTPQVLRVPVLITVGTGQIFKGIVPVGVPSGMRSGYAVEPESQRIDGNGSTEPSGPQGGELRALLSGLPRVRAIVEPFEEVGLTTTPGANEGACFPCPTA